MQQQFPSVGALEFYFYRENPSVNQKLTSDERISCITGHKDSGFYINEDLTKSNQKLFYTARVKCVLMLIPPGLRTGRLL